jgi:hypothetical protein
MLISVTVIEITDGEDENIAVLSQAICNGKKSWIQTHTIPRAIQEDANKSGDTTKQADRYSCHLQTTDFATTGLHQCHKQIDLTFIG